MITFLFNNPEKSLKSYRKLQEQNRDGGQCIKCGACETECPQGLDIRGWLDTIHETFK
ncbi:4Fe-4S dicluster domain-containing protein [Natranaerobius trueperi]|uniref:4Fe-4S ferredoxin-type domain-containing protein n=1 Tax=Natranaerobius trueperi TaxID=759412 RepID=A0A226C0R2_9FIRM|nr:4Fe-4S dicluster domain-containing protein [Natranaerobius trueperi]OWZ84816.1 hypothetical protein CDO51_02020 [Natranaerobius trueperi]